MKTSTGVAPTGVERSFGLNQLIVSKTDTKGVMTYVNDVFTQVSGYAPHEAVGQPHSLIRHPQMPRGVFKLLWDTISSGREIFAYVNNLAVDGSHYWVLAHVTPTTDANGKIVGYHSNRRRPARGPIEALTPIYSQMVSEERRHDRAIEAAAAGANVLRETLATAGLTYDQFIWQLISSEMAGGHQ